MLLSLDLHAEYYNHWPWLAVRLNDQLLFNGQIEQQQTLNFDVECKEQNQLTLEHYGKNFGENGIWDSDSQGQQSCSLKITDIRFDNVSGGIQLLSNLIFVSKWSEHQLTHDPELIEKYSEFNSHGIMSFNGTISVNFTTPVYNWLIDKKYKVPMTDTAYFSDYSSRWHYDEDRRLLNQIKQLVNYDQNRSH